MHSDFPKLCVNRAALLTHRRRHTHTAPCKAATHRGAAWPVNHTEYLLSFHRSCKRAGCGLDKDGSSEPLTQFAGTFEPELMLEIAQRNGLEAQLPFRNVAEARSAYQFHNLQSFLDIYYAGCAVLRTKQVRQVTGRRAMYEWLGSSADIDQSSGVVFRLWPALLYPPVRCAFAAHLPVLLLMN